MKRNDIVERFDHSTNDWVFVGVVINYSMLSTPECDNCIFEYITSDKERKLGNCGMNGEHFVTPKELYDGDHNLTYQESRSDLEFCLTDKSLT